MVHQSVEQYSRFGRLQENIDFDRVSVKNHYFTKKISSKILVLMPLDSIIERTI